MRSSAILPFCPYEYDTFKDEKVLSIGRLIPTENDAFFTRCESTSR
ncbi:hypothetical protein [Flavobacterium sp. CGRL2]